MSSVSVIISSLLANVGANLTLFFFSGCDSRNNVPFQPTLSFLLSESKLSGMMRIALVYVIGLSKGAEVKPSGRFDRLDVSWVRKEVDPWRPMTR
jgi:hypothetical protein